MVSDHTGRKLEGRNRKITRKSSIFENQGTYKQLMSQRRNHKGNKYHKLNDNDNIKLWENI